MRLTSTLTLFFFLTFGASIVLSETKTGVIVSESQNDLGQDQDEASVVEEVDVSDVFEATSEWQEIKPGQVVPAGLHFRVNLETGKKEAKLLDKGEESLKKIDDDAKTSDGVLRSYKDLHDIKAQEKLKFNTEFEMIDVLMKNYDNSSRDDKINILQDLEYLLHQYDNARDFVTVGGLESVVVKALESPDEVLQSNALLIVSACVQSHPDVKEKVLNKEWMNRLLDQVHSEKPNLIKKRAVQALANLIRGHARSWQEFRKRNGVETFLELLSKTNEEIQMKILVFFSDIFLDGKKLEESEIESNSKTVCDILSTLLSDVSVHDVDKVEKLADAITVLKPVCLNKLRLFNAESIIARLNGELAEKNNLEDLDVDHIVEKLTLLKQAMSLKDEL